MSIVSKIPTALKTFSGKPLAIASKMMGVATCAALVYDSHVNGKERAKVTDEIETGDRYYNQFKQYMTSDKESATICNMKKKWFEIQQDFGLYHPISKTKGYVGGFVNTVIKNLPYIAAATIALCKFKVPSKIAGVFLGLAGIKTLVSDVFGIGSGLKKEDRI